MVPPAPLDSLQARYRELLALCDSVEAIVDSIAGRMDRVHCIATAKQISALHLVETVEKPSHKHLAATLQSAAWRRSKFAWEAIDSMLRVFLDGLRRHVAAEQATIEVRRRPKTSH
ncbi:hypothetical protein [Sinorhizobium fredii]|uniref:hypothetical protein n=1 Tax=Rhizobium fredii TaxID=380 RepID=UPI0005956D11|nr:hypothetical protein [Sinorhizobium fredii]WOS63893.1 hypothetical protein SFGR64A_05780 [Sinorhizobium fredii GR64]